MVGNGTMVYDDGGGFIAGGYMLSQTNNQYRLVILVPYITC
jgi:hypothetical protein